MSRPPDIAVESVVVCNTCGAPYGGCDCKVDTPADGMAVATHSGVLTIMGERLKVHVLSSGQRIIDADDLERFFGVEK